MSQLSQRSRIIFYVLTVIVLIGGAVFWFQDLDSDPPSYFSGRGQSLATDPAQYVYHARNKVLFDDWDPFDYSRWTVYQHSLMSLVGYLCFSLSSVSRATAHVAGILLSLSGLLLLLAGLLRHFRPWTAAVAAFCFLINVTAFTYGRLSYLENGLLFLAALMFFIYSWYGDKLWGLIATAILAAAATFTGKLFGALLMPALLVTLFFLDKDERWKRIGIAVGAFLVSGLVLIFLLYGSDLTAAFGYVGEQSYGLRGFPEGLTSPWAFLEHVVSYGYKMRLFYLNPDILMYIVVSGTLLILVRYNKDSASTLRSVPRPLFFVMAWIALGWLGLAPLTYSPIRYSLLFLPAAIAVLWMVLDMFLKNAGRKLSVVWPGWTGMTAIALLWWILTYHTVANLFFFNLSSPPVTMLTWTTVVAVPVVLALGFFILKRHSFRFSRKWLIAVLAVALAVTTLVNGFRIRRLHFLDHAFTIQEACRDLGEIVGPDAVISGPYGPELTFDSKLKSFIHLFGVAEVDSTLFNRYPITHIAIDVSNAEEAVKQYPQIGGLKPIVSYWIRDIEVQVYNVAGAFSNPQANRYQPTHYERAISYYLAQQYDSSALEIERHLALHPETKSLGLLATDIIWKQKQYQAAMGLITNLAEKYPTDWNVQMQAAKIVQVVALMAKDNNLLARARSYYEKTAFVNRFRGLEAQKSYYDLMQRAERARQNAAGSQTP
ncbi:MAG TPA: hypothetical protein PLF13_02480 [candidate division Zixibacteria bacterium]|mgnify:CR=1 FL=1|nr:hypothetical protein [candidate division Zixibacteria bacterium]